MELRNEGSGTGVDGVSSLNSLTGAVTLAAGTNVTLGTVGNTITINSSGSGGMVYPGAGIPVSTGSAWAASISGTSSQFVKGDGSLDSSTYLTTSSASSTYIPYTGGTSNVDLGVHNLTVDTNSLFIDATNHILGIGTASPLSATKLTINDTVNTASFALTGLAADATTSTGGFKFVLTHNATSNRQMMFIDSGLAINSSNAAVRIVSSSGVATMDAISTDGSTGKTLNVGNSTGGVILAGNVGLGVVPTFKLVLAGGTQFQISASQGLTGFQIIGGDGAVNTLGTMGANEPLAIRTASVEAFRFLANGNLQISDPTGGATKTLTAAYTGAGFPGGTSLTIGAGNTVNSTANGGALTFNAGNGGGVTGVGGDITFNSGSGGTAKGAIVFKPGGTGNGAVFLDGTITTFGYRPSVGTGDIQLKSGTVSNGIGGDTYITANNGGNTAQAGGNVIITSGLGGTGGTAGVVRVLGNTGIWTTTPTVNFQVNQSATGVGIVTTAGTTALVGTGTQFTNTFKVGDTLTVSGETIRTIATITDNTHLTVTVAFSTTASGLAYTLTAANRFAVLGSGQVGIGTLLPTSFLQLAAGTANAGTSPLKFISGTNLTTTEAGAIEYNGTHLYFTASNGGTRFQLDQQASSLIVGTTTISSGSTTNILYNNAGVVGEYTITGSGNVVMSSAPTMTNPVVGTQSQGDNSTKAASTAYTDLAVSNAIAGVNPAIAVQCATTAASDTSGLTYIHVAGIGDTFTGTVNTAITIDGHTLVLGDRVLVKNDTQTSPGSVSAGTFNGVYVVTTIQSIGIAPILTRALDYDTPSDINNTGAIPVVLGTVNGSTSWVLTSAITAVGTGSNALTYTQFTLTPSSIVTLTGSQTLTNKILTSPTLTTPALGTPASGVMTNVTGLPAASVVAGTFGTGAYIMDTSLAVPQIFNADHAIAAVSNAATVTRAFRNNVVTNSSAATLTITLSTSGATGGDMVLIQIVDFSGVVQTITWVNTENSTVTAPTTSNGSTTSPLTVGFKWNPLTSKWRCVASC